jgi:APA family basic amino acid/polyamine antiporter
MDTMRQSSTGHLLRVLGFAFAMAICVGTIIGGGILRTPGAVAERVPEPWIILLIWTLGGVHALLGANVVAEISTSVPKAGGLYVPTRRAFGDFAGLLVGWSDWLVNAAAAAALALVFADFAAMAAPQLASHEPAVASAVLLVLFGLNWLGVREGGAVQTVGTLLKFLLLVTLVVGLFAFVPAAVSQPASAPPATWTVLGLVVAYQLVYGVFSGWPSPIFFVEEDENSARNIPRGMALSIVTVTLVYLAINAALLHALPIEELRTSELPAATALAKILGNGSIQIVAAVALVIVGSCLNGVVMVLPRILYGLGRDGLFIPAATRVNKGGTPDIALALSGALTLVLTLTGTFETVFLLMGALVIFGMIISEVSLFALRIREPKLARPFRAIGYPVLPVLLLLIDTALLVAVLVSDPMSGVYMFALVALCVPVGLWIRWRKSAVAVRPA